MIKFKEIESIMKWLNVLLFQWLFVRFYATVDEKTGAVSTVGFFGGVVPLTGWWGDYRYITRNGKPRFLWMWLL